MFTRLSLICLFTKTKGDPILIAGLISLYLQEIKNLDKLERARFLNLLSTQVFRKTKNLHEVALVLFFNEDFNSLGVPRLLNALKKNFWGSIPAHLFEQPLTSNQMTFLSDNSIMLFELMSGHEFICPENSPLVIDLLLKDEKICDLQDNKMNDVQIKVWHILSTIYSSNPLLVKNFLNLRITPIWLDNLDLLIPDQFRILECRIYPLTMDSYSSCEKYYIPYYIDNERCSKYSTLRKLKIIQDRLKCLAPKIDLESVIANVNFLNIEPKFNESVMVCLHNFRLGLIDSRRLTLEEFEEFTTQVVFTTRSNQKLIRFLMRFGLDIKRIMHCIPMHIRKAVLEYKA